MRSFIIFFVLSTLLLQSCDFNISTANITNVKVCTSIEDNKCDSDNSSISINTPVIYATADLENLTEGLVATIIWQFDNSGTWYEIDKVELKINNMNQIKSSLSAPTNGWPLGNYQVIFLLNTDNSKPITKSFTIN